MPDTNIIMTPFQAWLMISILSAIFVLLGFLGKKGLEKLDNVCTASVRQEVLNEVNDSEHSGFKSKLEEHHSKIDNHELRIQKLED